LTGAAPVISVVIPCFNGERFVPDAVRSVLAQTLGAPEVIVVDDRSSDRSVEVVEPLTAGGMVRLVRHDENRGIAAARNTGIRAARGRFIGLLDQDDLWREDKLARQIEVFERDAAGRIGAVFSHVDVLDLATGVRRRQPVRLPRNIERMTADEVLVQLFLGDFFTLGSSLIRKECFEVVGPLDEEIRSGSDDFELFVRLAPRFRFACVPEPLAVRRLHEGNYTDAERMVPDALRILERTARRHPCVAGIASRARGYHLLRLARHFHAKGDRVHAAGAYRESIRAHPGSAKAIAGLVLCSMGKSGDALIGMLRKLGRRPR